MYCVAYHVLLDKKVVLTIMENWEINGNLADEQCGMPNYQVFEKIICDTKNYFNAVFDVKCLNKVPFYVDNNIFNPKAPISTPVLKQFIIITLGIYYNDCEARIAYQFAHELTHVVFWAYFGFDKKRATEREEAICTAASLIAIKNMYPDYFVKYEKYTESLDNIGYRNGVPLAREIFYDMKKIKSLIETFPRKLLYEIHS